MATSKFLATLEIHQRSRSSVSHTLFIVASVFLGTLTATSNSAWACKIIEGKLICDPPPTPTPGGGTLSKPPENQLKEVIIDFKSILIKRNKND